MTNVPDFERMASLIEEIYELSQNKMFLDLDIKFREAEIVKEATTDSKYFVNGKTPSMDYIKSSLMIVGLNGELVEKRTALAKVTASLEKAKNVLQLNKDILDVWRTEQANERKAVL